MRTKYLCVLIYLIIDLYQKSDSGFDLLMQVIYVCKKENWPEDRALWDAGGDWDFSELIPLITTACFSLSKKPLIHFRVCALMS